MGLLPKFRLGESPQVAVIQIWAVASCDVDVGGNVVLETGLVGTCEGGG